MGLVYLDELIRVICHGGLATISEFRGCTAEEIASVEEQFGCRLPEAYREFLSVMGRGAGKFQTGRRIFYDGWYYRMRPGLKELITERGLLESLLSDDTFVFWDNQGYQYMCFETQECPPNPPVLFFEEGATKFEPIAPTITEALVMLARNDIGFDRKLS